MDCVLQVDNLSKYYNDTLVLDDISFRLHEKEVISVIGSSGAGKSTFLRCLNFLENPSFGTFSYFGKELELKRTQENLYPASSYQLLEIRRRLAMVFQNFNLWSHFTVLQNVTEVPIHVLKIPKDEAIASGESYLEKVGLLHLKDRYPSVLSGGEKQRVGIARALAVNPKILLFDEATSALDPERVQEVLDVIRKLSSEGRAMILVTHEIKFAKDISDRILFLEKGKISFFDTVEKMDLLSPSDRLYRFIKSTI